VLWVVLLPEAAGALPDTPVAQAEPQNRLAAGQVYNPVFALAPGLAPAIGNMWLAIPPWASPIAAPGYRSLTPAAPLIENLSSPAFDIGGYDPMWDDTMFTEISAYGGLGRDALRVAGMRAMDGSDGTSGAIPYGHLTVQREFQEGQHHVGLGAYGLQVSVQPTAISGFGNDSYTDVAIDGTWHWTAHPERSVPDVISAHVLLLHETEDLIASQAVFGTRRTDDLTIFRGDVSYIRGSVTPTVQYFQVTGSSDAMRLGTLDGSPDSSGWIARIDFSPWSSPNSWFNVRLGLQFIAYSQFDGSSRDASRNNTVLLHLSAGGESDP
jgi:hypothetical protein